MEIFPCVNRQSLVRLIQDLLDAVVVGIVEAALHGLDGSNSLEELIHDIILCSSHYGGGVCDKNTAVE